jgi:hypothetical protein
MKFSAKQSNKLRRPPVVQKRQNCPGTILGLSCLLINWPMNTVKKAVLSLLLGVSMLLPGAADATESVSYPASPQTEAQDGIFGKKKKKDCDCPGNKKNRRKVARARRKNRTAVLVIPRAVASPARIG